MDSLTDIPWRAAAHETPETEGWYLVQDLRDETEAFLAKFVRGRWFHIRHHTEIAAVKWCPIIPINRDGSITLGNYAHDNPNQQNQAAHHPPALFDEARELLVRALSYCWGSEKDGTQSLIDRIQSFLHKCRTQEALAEEAGN